MGVKEGLKHTLWITWKDLLEFWRRRVGVVMFILMPLIMMAMIGFIFPSQTVLRGTQVSIVNYDNGEWGNNLTFLVNVVNENLQLNLKNVGSIEEAKRMIINGEADGAIIIPENFSELLNAGEQGTVEIMTDQSNPQLSQMLSGLMTQVLQGISQQWAKLRIEQQLENVNSTAMVSPYEIEEIPVVGKEMSYFDFMAPGIMMMVVIMSVLTGLPRAIAYEKDVGTMSGFLVAPISRSAIIGGKALSRIIRGLIQGLMVLLLSMVLFGVTIQGNFLSVLLMLLLGVFSFIGLGIVLTSLAEDEETAGAIIMTLTFPMMFLSGIFFPIELMPGFMQTLAYCLPFVYAVDGMRKVMIFGVGLGEIWLNVLLLLGFGAVMLAIAVPVFRRAMNR